MTFRGGKTPSLGYFGAFLQEEMARCERLELAIKLSD